MLNNSTEFYGESSLFEFVRIDELDIDLYERYSDELRGVPREERLREVSTASFTDILEDFPY